MNIEFDAAAELKETEKGVRIKPYFSIIIHSPDSVELRCGGFNTFSHFLNDSEENGTLARIVEALDGSSGREIAKKAKVSRSAVEGVIDHLVQIGAVDFGASSALDAYFDLVAPALRTRDSVYEAKMPVTIIGAGKLAEIIYSSVAELLPDADIEILPDDMAAALTKLSIADFDIGLKRAETEVEFAPLSERFLIFAQAAADPHRALVFNRLALLLNTPWLSGAIDGPTALVGPLTVGNQSACYQCFETRVMMNLRETNSYQKYKAALARGALRQASHPTETALQHIIGGHMALEAVNFLTTGSGFTIGKVLGIYLPTMEFTFNDVLRMPGCPACGPEPIISEPELYFDMRAVLGGQSD